MISKSGDTKNVLVSMKATFRTDGNSDTRRRIIKAQMDADKIINSKSLQNAIDYFQSQISYIDSIENFEFFIINGKTYEAEFWKIKVETSL
jgi:hypothetical protein